MMHFFLRKFQPKFTPKTGHSGWLFFYLIKITLKLQFQLLRNFYQNKTLTQHTKLQGRLKPPKTCIRENFLLDSQEMLFFTK